MCYAQGNTNHYTQMLMWVLPFAAIYYYLSLKYEKQIAKLQKKWKKYQVSEQSCGSK